MPVKNGDDDGRRRRQFLFAADQYDDPFWENFPLILSDRGKVKACQL